MPDSSPGDQADLTPEERRANTPPLGADEPPQPPTDDDRAAELEAYAASEQFHDDAKRYVAPDGTAGGQRADDKDKIRFDLVPPWPFYLLGQVYTIGAKKYGDDNWKKGMSWMRMVGSMKRHLEAFIMGESMDPEDGQHHLASVAWGAFALMEYELFRPEFDDRPANVGAIAAALAERADVPTPPVVAPEPPPAEELTDEEKDAIDHARELLATKSQAAAQYLTDPQAPADDVEPPEDLAAELAERPAVLAEMTAADDLTDEEQELVRRAEEIAAAESPEVKQNRAERRRQEKIERKAERKPAPRVAPGTGPDHSEMSVGKTRFDDVNQAARRGF